MDEPKALGGADEGPNPLEYVVASLNGCKGVMIPLIAKELGFQFSQLSFDTKGVIDLRGLMGQEGISANSQTLISMVDIRTDESDDRLQKIHAAVSTCCPSYK